MEEYSFMQETIKDEQSGPKKIATKVGKWLGLGLAFGMAACVSFYALEPWAKETFKGEPTQVDLSSQEVEGDESNVSQSEDVQKQELTLNDFYTLNNELKQVANGAQKSIVELSGLSENADWTTGQANVIGSTSGLIVADNGRELLILADYSSMKSTKIFQVKFADGSIHQASFKQKDGTLDFAVFSVAKDGISESTNGNIKIASFGNSKRLGQGRTVIAVGRPFGYENSVAFGVASTVNESVTLADGEYGIIVTDMQKVEGGSGFLFDIDGNVMGYIEPSLGKGTLAAYSISDVTAEIEMMSNGKHVPYAGIVGTMVTEETSELYEIPVGLYVTEVELDSPAMNAGIQNGDIITKVGDVEITSLDVYHEALYKTEAGHSVKVKGQRYGTDSYVSMDFTVTIGIKE